MKQRGPLVIHPFLVSAYPVLHLLSRNLNEVEPVEVIRPLAVVLILSGAMFALGRAIIRNSVKAGTITSLLMIGILFYGHVFKLVTDTILSQYVVGRNIVFLPAWCALILGLCVSVARSRRDLRVMNSYLNLLGGTLVGLALLNIVIFQVKAGSQGAARSRWRRFVQASCARESLPKPERFSPDIYYIVLDEYVGPDVMKSFVGLDDNAFVGFLERKGFHVYRDARSNYLRTYPSLASSLNMEYVQDLTRKCGITRINDRILGMMIRDSKVVRLLKEAGYTFVFFPSDYQATTANPNADVIVARHRIRMSEFDNVLFSTTVFQPFDGWSGNRRRKVQYMFEKLPDVARMTGPKFVFAHITVPHPPYVFNADGSMPARKLLVSKNRPQEEYRRLYAGQVRYTNRMVSETVEKIFAASESRPVIILQGDHGLKPDSCPGMKIPPNVRCTVLNAIFLPDGPAYMGITPVNTFREIFDTYFDAGYPLLPNRTYADRWVGPVGGELRFEPHRVQPASQP